MSNYDYRPNDLRGSRAFDYDSEGSGFGGWAAILALAILALIVVLGFASGTSETGAEATAPAAAITE